MRNEHLRSEGHLFREEGRKHCSIQKPWCVSTECREQWLLLHKHLSAGWEHSTAWKTEAPWLLTSVGYSWMSSALKNSFHFGDVWEHQSSSPVPLYTNCGPVQAHNITWSEPWLSPGSTAASQGQIFPLAASFPVALHLETGVKDEPKGAVHHCFPWGCAPGATSDSNFCLSFILSRIWVFRLLHLCPLIPSSAFLIKTLPKMTASSVLSLKLEGNFLKNTFPLSCFLPLSSCLLLLTQAYFLIKRGRSYWKAA